MLLLFSLNIPELLTESVDSVKNPTSRHHRVTSHHIVETVLLLCASPRVHFQEALFLVASAELGPLKRKIFFDKVQICNHFINLNPWSTF